MLYLPDDRMGGNGKVPHSELLPSEKHAIHNPIVAEPNSTVFFPLKEKI
jgi:hypothetical protein